MKTCEQATADARERAALMHHAYVVFQDLWELGHGYGCVSRDLWDKAGPFRTLKFIHVIEP